MNAFDYDLPENAIATYPLENPEDAKFLSYIHDTVKTHNILNLIDVLPAHTCFIGNNSKVIPARIVGFSIQKKALELFIIELLEERRDHQTAICHCMVGGIRNWPPHHTLNVTNDQITLSATFIERHPKEGVLIQFQWTSQLSISWYEVLVQFGTTPIPPYLNRPAEPVDALRYQTVYATHKGSVAAPTAGLHFTSNHIADLIRNGFKFEYLTLHVGPGTFKPVKAAHWKDHVMHEEYVEISKSCVEFLCANPASTICAIGTTSLRTLESFYWIAVKILKNNNLAEPLFLEQDFPETQNWKAPENFNPWQVLLKWMHANQKQNINARTALMIHPQYKIQSVGYLWTNFHQPRSTLLMLVEACIGPVWKSLYMYALNHNFRFLSYGDACLFEIKRR